MSTNENSVALRKLADGDWLATFNIDAELARCARATVPIETLMFSDSPRITGENTDHIRALVEVEDGLPAIVVHRSTMRVIDGVHRLRAAMSRGDTHIAVLFFEGSDEDAFVLAVRLNAAHGLPLSRAERSAAAQRIIASHSAWSNRAIAAVTGLSSKTVATLRQRTGGDDTPPVARIGRDGRVRPLSSAEARRRVGELFAERPDASLREVAREAGVSVGTVRDVRRRLRDGSDPVPLRQRQVEQKMKDVPHAITPHSVTRHSQDAGQEALPRPWRTPSLGQLKRDPSLRFNEIGREILRLLDAAALDAEQWRRYTDSVPPHCTNVVAEVARHCSQAWDRFAQQLEERDEEAGTPAVRKIM